ncbi:MAG: hypothetical protein BroJett021_45680 [Chloroflexota bacterium]|nr:hypothetical protein [Caldilinea sp.]GIK75580.1 MAG: hypothetical protein BroJett021_45680 [Chloroflexota bacterium]
MAEATEISTVGTEQMAPARRAIVFGGETRNMVMGITMLGGGVAAFIAGLTDTFFAEATAWTFIAWGALFLYGDLLLATRRFIVTDEGLEISIPFRFWNRHKAWEWKNIYRMDVIIDRRNTHPKDCQIQVYHQYPGEIAIDREDRDFDSELAALIIERAGLKPDSDAVGVDLSNLPFGKSTVLTWKR